MTKLNENTIEEFAISLFEELGYEYIYAPDIAPGTDNAERLSFEDILWSTCKTLCFECFQKK